MLSLSLSIVYIKSHTNLSSAIFLYVQERQIYVLVFRTHGWAMVAKQPRSRQWFDYVCHVGPEVTLHTA